MLNQAVPEALMSATYVEHYLDGVEDMPDEIQRFITRIRELDVKYRSEYHTTTTTTTSFIFYLSQSSPITLLIRFCALFRLFA